MRKGGASEPDGRIGGCDGPDGGLPCKEECEGATLADAKVTAESFS